MLNQTDFSNRQSHPKPIGLIVLFSLAGLLIFSAVVLLGIYFGLKQAKENGPIPVRYYMAIRDQNYALAYTYLSMDAKVNDQKVNLETFTQQAALADSQGGKVEGFTVEGDQNAPDGVILQLHRSNQKYNVHLSLKQIDGRLQIVSASRI